MASRSVRVKGTLRELVEEGKLGSILRCFEEKIVERGKRYSEEGRVKEKAFLSENYLHGVVEGTRIYRTDVFLHGGKLYAVCTCPYEIYCKHAVALLLSFSKAGLEERELTLEEFKEELLEPLYKYGFLEFSQEEWLNVIERYGPEKILEFLIDLSNMISRDYEEGEIPYIREEPLCLDELVETFIRTVPEGLRGVYFYKYLKGIYESEYYLLCTPGLIFRTFSEEDRERLKELLRKDSKVAYDIAALAYTGL